MRKEADKGNHRIAWRIAPGVAGDPGFRYTAYPSAGLCSNQLPGRGCREGRQLDSILRILRVLGDFRA